MIGENFRNNLHRQGLDKLIPVLFQNGFDPQNVDNRRLKVFSHDNEACKRTSLSKKKQRTVHRQGIINNKNDLILNSTPENRL